MHVQRFQIRRDQLRYQYHWTTYRQDDPRLTGAPDSTLINRHEGYEVLPFINRFLRRGDWQGEPNLNDAHKVERMLREFAPGHLRSREHLNDWIAANWQKY